MTVKMDVAALREFLARDFPQVSAQYQLEAVTEAGVQVRLVVGEGHLRPGGTVSGPSIFALADLAVYMAVLSRIGPEALAVTSNASLDFLRKPVAGRDLIGECRLLKLGRRLAVGDVLIRSEGDPAPVARATMTYAIPAGG